MLNHSYVSIGFGNAHHIFGKYLVKDSNKRASYSFAHPRDNPRDEIRKSDSIYANNCKNLLGVEESIERYKYSVLTLCPYVSSSVINENLTLETYDKPAGVSAPGDSGGGVFRENGKLIGVNSNGNGETRGKEIVLEQTLYLKDKEKAEEYIKVAQERYKKRVAEITTTQPDKLEAFLLDSPFPKMPRIIKANEIQDFFKPALDYKLIVGNATCNKVAICFHKEWLVETLHIIKTLKINPLNIPRSLLESEFLLLDYKLRLFCPKGVEHSNSIKSLILETYRGLLMK